MNDLYKVNLLWTGGWDSTFRLLQLIVEQKVDVEPIYIIDTSRSSTNMEIKTLSRLKSLIKKSLPSAFERIGKFKFYSIDEIKHDKEITSSFIKLKNEAHLGGQYDWLARFCKQYGINWGGA